MKKSNKIIVFLGIMLTAGLVLLAPAGLRAAGEDRIAEGVYIGNISVGGMTEKEAADAVSSYVKSVGDAVLTLTAGEKSVEVTAAELGTSFTDMNVIQKAMDVCRSGNLIKRYKDKKDLENGNVVIDMVLDVDEDVIATLLEEKADQLDQEAVDSTLTRENGEFQIVEGAQGIEVNIEKSVEDIENYISGEWNGTDGSIELTAEIVEPKGTKEELSKIKDLLGSYSTNYNSSTQNRCDNISNAASKINGTVLYPGEEFSVYETIGPLDASNGYELAGAYENGQTVQSYGGGVCQVSTTLYNAAILAELEITERSNHSMIVTYVKPSMDAAIAGDYKDLKFVNNQDTPIFIEGYTQGKNVFFNIFGQETRPANRKVTYESEVVSQQDPGTQFVGTGDPVGYIGVSQEKHTGYVAQLWKIVTVDGVEESREIYNKSTYKASPKIVNVGTASADPNASAAIGAALATGDEATIYAAVAPYTAAASAVQQPAEPTPSAEEQAIIGDGQVDTGISEGQ
ncbi:MAG: VanW family protein [Clostridiales bacterium]|nr:VanW family protein [Clostridiales bacterium]